MNKRFLQTIFERKKRWFITNTKTVSKKTEKIDIFCTQSLEFTFYNFFKYYLKNRAFLQWQRKKDGALKNIQKV